MIFLLPIDKFIQIFSAFFVQLCLTNVKRLVDLHLKHEKKWILRVLETGEKQDWKPIEYALIGLESRRALHADLNLGTMHNNANYDYTLHPSVIIGKWINYACIAVP